MQPIATIKLDTPDSSDAVRAPSVVYGGETWDLQWLCEDPNDYISAD